MAGARLPVPYPAHQTVTGSSAKLERFSTGALVPGAERRKVKAQGSTQETGFSIHRWCGIVWCGVVLLHDPFVRECMGVKGPNPNQICPSILFDSILSHTLARTQTTNGTQGAQTFTFLRFHVVEQ